MANVFDYYVAALLSPVSAAVGSVAGGIAGRKGTLSAPVVGLIANAPISLAPFREPISAGRRPKIDEILTSAEILLSGALAGWLASKAGVKSSFKVGAIAGAAAPFVAVSADSFNNRIGGQLEPVAPLPSQSVQTLQVGAAAYKKAYDEAIRLGASASAANASGRAAADRAVQLYQAPRQGKAS